MRYPFKDQAKSSSETLIPVDLSPPCPLFGTKFYPILKEKVFNSKSKLPQLNITTKRRRPLWGEKEKATTKILLLRNCGHSRNCFFRKSVVRPAGGQRRDTNQQIIRMLGEIFSSSWYYLNLELMQHIIGLIYSWHLSWTKRKASLQPQTQKFLFIVLNWLSLSFMLRSKLPLFRFIPSAHIQFGHFSCLLFKDCIISIFRQSYNLNNVLFMRTFHWKLYRPPVSVVVLFFVSWAPFHFQRLGYVYFREHEYFRTVNQYLFYLSGCFYFLSSTLNPVLYNLMSAKYRQAFHRALLCKPPNSPSRPIDNACPTTGTNLLNRWAKIILMKHCP